MSVETPLDVQNFEKPAVGYAVLVTWPETRSGRHLQDVWYAHISEQPAAVKAVQEACGAMNDAKIELLGHMSKGMLLEHGVPEGAVKKGNPLPDA